MSIYGEFRRWWASRTINFGALLTLAGLALEYLQSREADLVSYFGDHGPLVFTGIGLAVIALRLVTSKPIGKPSRDEP